MSKKESAPGVEKDADGLVLQKYRSMVLVVVPPKEFGEECLRYARSSLFNVHVGTWSVSTQSPELVRGRLQDEFQVDGQLSQAGMAAYSGVLFAGGEGALDLTQNPDALRLAREAHSSGKLVAAWGHAVAILAAAGVLKGRRATGHPSVAAAMRATGARVSSRQVEHDGNVVTGLDEASGMRFGKALAAVVGI